MLDNITEISTNLAIAAIVISIFLIWRRYSRLPLPFKWLAVFQIINLITLVVSGILFDRAINNLPLLHLYTILEFLALSLFFRSLIKNPTWLPRHFWIFVLSVISLMLLNSAFLQSIYEFNSYAKTLVQVIIITYCVLYFYNLSNEVDHTDSFQRSLRLINSALIVYYSGSLFIFMFSNLFLSNAVRMPSGLWLFNALLYLVFQLLILISVWGTFRRTNSFS